MVRYLLTLVVLLHASTQRHHVVEAVPPPVSSEGLPSTESSESSSSMAVGLASTSSIAGIASPSNTLLLELGSPREFYTLDTLAKPIRIQSDVPVTVQRFIDPAGYTIGTYDLYDGGGAILVTSNCDSGQTTVVPVVQELPREKGANTTVWTIALPGVTDEEAMLMPFLESSSYRMVYTSTEMYDSYTTAGVGPTDPISRYVGCRTEEACRVEADKLGYAIFNVGKYPTGGCFVKNERAYFSTVGDVDGPVVGIQQRIYCEEIYHITDVDVPVPVTTDPPVGTPVTTDPPVSAPSTGGTCITEAECRETSTGLGFESFVTGTFPTKGCFYKMGAKDGKITTYWSEGGTMEEMSKSELPGIQERIVCGSDNESTPTIGATECELGPMADAAKTCGNDEFCQLDTGTCITKIGFFTGNCAIKPEACTMEYDPVCGCDSLTYGNECAAHGNGTSVSYVGECGDMGIGDMGIVTASKALAYPENIESFAAKSDSATSSAFSIKNFVLGHMLHSVISSPVVKKPIPVTRSLQDTCTYNVEVLLSGCSHGNYANFDAPYAQIEVVAPKARVIESIMEPEAKETTGFSDVSTIGGRPFIEKKIKNTVLLIFPDDQAQTIDGVGNEIYASAPDPVLEEGTCAPIAIGRPFIDSGGRNLVASFVSANECGEPSSWLGEASKLFNESESMASTTIMPTNQFKLGDTWTKSALGEHASVASFAAFSIALMTNNAPSNLIEDSFKAALDEVRHAKVSFAIASKLTGKDITPGPLPPSNHHFNRDLIVLAMAVAKEGCIDETLSALAAAAEVELINDVLENGAGAGTKYYGIAREMLIWIRDELGTISMDESNHSSLAWRTLDWVCDVDVVACDAVRQSVLEENKLIEAFQRRFGRNIDYPPKLLERMMMAWRNIYTGRFFIGATTSRVDNGVEEVTGNYASTPSVITHLVENISRGGSYSA